MLPKKPERIICPFYNLSPKTLGIDVEKQLDHMFPQKFFVPANQAGSKHTHTPKDKDAKNQKTASAPPTNQPPSYTQDLTSKQNKGIGLLELLLVLTVIASIVVASSRYYFTARDSTRVTQTIHVVNDIRDASFQWLQMNNVADFSSLGNESTALGKLVDAGFLPESYRSGDNLSPWPTQDRKVHITSSTTALEIKINLIPATACTDLAAKFQKAMVNAECNTTAQYFRVQLTPGNS